MRQRKKNKSNHLRSPAIKITIALLAIWFIYDRAFKRENIQVLFDEYKNIFLDRSKFLLLIVIVLLMLMNWSVEAVKWKIMISKIQRITFLKSLEAVFSGLTISFFTPNRIGEYAGRIFHLSPSHRMKAVLITVMENLSQLLVTVIAGSISLIFYLRMFTHINTYFFAAAVVLLIAFVSGCTFLFLNVSFLEIILRRIRWTKSWLQYTEVFSYYSYRELVNVILLAAVRYFIFTSQFYLLLVLFGIRIPYPVALLLISMIYYVMSLVPTIALTEIGVRGAVAVFFLGQITDQPIEILNSTLSLWLINLVIPALIGTVFIFMFNLEKAKAA